MPLVPMCQGEILKTPRILPKAEYEAFHKSFLFFFVQISSCKNFKKCIQ